MDSLIVKKQIREKAQELGFDLVRFTAANLPEKYEKHFEQWVKDGQHAEMDYLSRRVEDSEEIEVLPGAKTVISLATNYFQGDLRDSKPNPLEPSAITQDIDNGRVARYAVTRDYHKIISSRLKKLATFIEDSFGAKTRYYVDTGPVLERAYSEESGVGYTGRNTCVITKEFGSWVFLSEIFLDIELEPSNKSVNLSCGSCRRCVDLCPTGAINENKTIDSRKCISYLTIENRGPIPLELRDKIGNWIYGCDICQDVCPHNAKSLATKAEEFKDIRIKDRKLSLKEILSIKDDEEFLKIFAGTPLMRAKRRGLLRNACVVAGNSGNKNLLPFLKNLAEQENDQMLVEHALWAIEKLEIA